MPLIVSSEPPLLVSVVVCGLVDDPTAVATNVSDDGTKETPGPAGGTEGGVGAIAVPVRPMIVGLPTPSLMMVIWPEKVPTASGVKVIVNEQPVNGGTVAVQV